MATATDVLGHTRDVARHYPDGSWDCPFCSHPVIVPRDMCENPWCVAHPAMPHAAARTVYAAEAARAADEAYRKRNHEAAMARIAEEQTRRQREAEAIDSEAEARGACRRCAHKAARYGAPKYIRHRGPCPHATPGRATAGR